MLYNFQFTGIEHHTPILNIEKMCVKTKIRLLFVSLLSTELHGRHGFHGKRIKKIREIRA